MESILDKLLQPDVLANGGMFMFVVAVLVISGRGLNVTLGGKGEDKKNDTGIRVAGALVSDTQAKNIVNALNENSQLMNELMEVMESDKKARDRCNTALSRLDISMNTLITELIRSGK